MRKFISKQSGITLLELLVTIAISSIFITLIFSILTTTINQNDKTLSHINLRQEANLIITEMRSKHQAGVTYSLCKDSLLTNNLVSFEDFRIFNTVTNCKNDIDPKINMPVKFTLSDNENNMYEIDTIIKGTKGITRNNAIKVVVPTKSTDSFYEILTKNNVAIYGKKYSFHGNIANGENRKIIIKGDINTKNLNGGSMSNISNIEVDGSIYLDGGDAGLGSKNSPGKILVNGDFTTLNGQRHIYGEVYVNGNFKIKDPHIHGQIYVDGNIEIGWTPTMYTDSIVYYTGSLSFPPTLNKNIISKFVKVDKVPKVELTKLIEPKLKSPEWFQRNNYSSSNVLKSNMKLFVKNYAWSGWHDAVSNIVIVSETDITLKNIGGTKVSGVLFAPNGTVTFDGGGTRFEGIIISRDEVYISIGAEQVYLHNIKDYFPTAESSPFY